MALIDAYVPRRAARSEFARVRGLALHLQVWGDASLATPERPPLVLVHGWIDVGASFQFMVDALAEERHVVAPDWRGFGLSEAPGADAYWFPDYLGDLDALLDRIAPDTPVDLVGHSMGGNVAMIYAGVRPGRVRKLVNLEGFGMPRVPAELAPKRYADWLDELKAPQRLTDYATLADVAARLRKNNPRLPADRAAWLAPHWARQDAASGRWVILGDPAHKRTNPVLYRVEEALACWERIDAPVLFVEGSATQMSQWWGERYGKPEFESRIARVPRLARALLQDAGHMLHHDQPQALAERVESFLA